MEETRMTTAITSAPSAPPVAGHPVWCDPEACFGQGFHASDSLGPDTAPWVTLCRTDEDGRTWLSLNAGDVFLPPMTVGEAQELASAILQLVAAARQICPAPS
jgi:hypothetical protein